MERIDRIGKTEDPKYYQDIPGSNSLNILSILSIHVDR